MSNEEYFKCNYCIEYNSVYEEDGCYFYDNDYTYKILIDCKTPGVCLECGSWYCIDCSYYYKPGKKTYCFQCLSECENIGDILKEVCIEKRKQKIEFQYLKTFMYRTHLDPHLIPVLTNIVTEYIT